MACPPKPPFRSRVKLGISGGRFDGRAIRCNSPFCAFLSSRLSGDGLKVHALSLGINGYL